MERNDRNTFLEIVWSWFWPITWWLATYYPRSTKNLCRKALKWLLYESKLMSKSFFMGSPNFKNRRGPVSGFFTGWGIISAKWFQLTLSNIKWTNFDFRVWFDLLTRETLKSSLDERKTWQTKIDSKNWNFNHTKIGLLKILLFMDPRTVQSEDRVLRLCCYYFLVLVRGFLLRVSY